MVAVLKPPKLHVLPMTLDRLDAVMAIEQDAYPFPWSRGNFADSLDAGYSAWLFHEGSTLVGYALFTCAAGEAHLLNITIAASRQGEGLGTFFFAKMLDRAREQGAVELFLEVRPSNWRALRLYERAGLRRVGLRKGYYPDRAGRREDAVVLGISL